MLPALTYAGRRALIRLDAPERRNALGPDDVRALSDAFAEIDRSDTADVAILTSAGDTFCSGYDLRALREDIRTGRASGAETAFAAMVDALERLRIPTICAIRGGAYGGGSDVALACDFRIGTPHTIVAVPAARFGLQFYSGGLRRFVDRVGIDVAKRTFLLAEPLDAQTLLRVGYLHAIVEDRELDAAIDALASRIADNAPSAVRGLKRSLDAIARGEADLDAIDAAFAASLRSPETAARLGPGDR